MVHALSPISIPAAPEVSPSTGKSGGNFAEIFSQAVQNVNGAQNQVDTSAENLVVKGSGELHSTILAAQSAELDFELFLQVRNKVVTAYEEIMRMQV